MSINLRFVVSICTASLAANSASADFSEWTINQEKEVDEGYYAKPVFSADGWRVWRFETEKGVTCNAVKSADGKASASPSGYKDSFEGPTPYVILSRGFGDRISIDVRGKWGFGAKWRDVGARFWNDEISFNDLKVHENKIIQVHLETYQYPAIYRGLWIDDGVVDLAGLSGAVDALAKCDPSIIFPRAPFASGIEPLTPIPIPSLSDLPSQYIRSGAKARVNYKLTVSTVGKVTGCEANSDNDDPEIEKETCAYLLRRAKFGPLPASAASSAIYEDIIVWSYH